MMGNLANMLRSGHGLPVRSHGVLGVHHRWDVDVTICTNRHQTHRHSLAMTGSSTTTVFFWQKIVEKIMNEREVCSSYVDCVETGLSDVRSNAVPRHARSTPILCRQLLSRWIILTSTIEKFCPYFKFARLWYVHMRSDFGCDHWEVKTRP